MELISPKYASKLPEITSSAGEGFPLLERSEMPRRRSSANYIRYENSYARAPELEVAEINPPMPKPMLNSPNIRMGLPRSIISRRTSAPYVYNRNNGEKLWFQRQSSIRKPHAPIERPPMKLYVDSYDKASLIPPPKLTVVQPQLPPSTPPVLQQQTPIQPVQPQLSRERNLSASVELKQVRLQQRVDQLNRRLRRMQFMQSRLHVDNELKSTITSVQRALDDAVSVRDDEAMNDARNLINDESLEQKLENLIKTGILKPELFNSPELRNATTSELTQILQRHEPNLKRILALITSSATISNLSSSNYALPVNVVLDEEDRRCLGQTTNCLQSHLTCLERNYDTDATESSSGGESCDEDEKEVENDDKRTGKIRRLALEQRASWQWWTERAWIGSRWAWIHFQLADLEYKIRQHVDLYKQLRSRKTRPSFPSMLSKKGMEIQNSKTGPISGDDSHDDDFGTALEGCARTRPVELTGRRRITCTQGMFRWNKKTCVRSTVMCGCIPPYSPCVTCGGRMDVKEPIDVQQQTKNVRNAILEPTFHPILTPSKRKGITFDRKLQLYWSLSKLPARSSTWFPQPKTIVSLLPSHCESKTPKSEQSSGVKARRGRKPGSVLSKRLYGKSLKAKTLKKHLTFKSAYIRRNSGNSIAATSQDDGYTEAGKVGARRTTDRQSTFDIDNIFVDPKVAAVTRVERIPYKEIQTPKWRITDLTSSYTKKMEDRNELEDLSDAVFGVRHGAKETEEKKRFTPILIRDFHINSRKSHFQRQPSSVESNCSYVTNFNRSQSISSSIISMSNNERISVDSSMELSYEPFPPRHFPLDEEQFEIANLNCVVYENGMLS